MSNLRSNLSLKVTKLKIPSKAGSVVLVPNLITSDETSVLSKTFAIDANSKFPFSLCFP